MKTTSASRTWVLCMALAKAANAHDFVVKLPHGYDTIVGEHTQHVPGIENQAIFKT